MRLIGLIPAAIEPSSGPRRGNPALRFGRHPIMFFGALLAVHNLHKLLNMHKLHKLSKCGWVQHDPSC